VTRRQARCYWRRFPGTGFTGSWYAFYRLPPEGGTTNIPSFRIEVLIKGEPDSRIELRRERRDVID
jgi:hypothetical protein